MSRGKDLTKGSPRTSLPSPSLRLILSVILKKETSVPVSLPLSYFLVFQIKHWLLHSQWINVDRQG